MDKILNPKFPIKLKIIISFSFILIFTTITIGYLSYNVSSNQLETSGKQIMQNTVQMTRELVILKNKEVLAGMTSLADAQEDIKEFILGPMSEDGTRPINKNIYLGDNGYLFILNSKGYEIAHPTIEGIDASDASDLSNPEYKFVIDMIDIAKSGGGFTYYSWYFPYSEEIGPKINYCLYYEPWDWIIVSSIYLIDFNYGANKIIKLITIHVIFTILLSIIISIYISKNITKPLIQITNSAMLISEDNFNIENFNISNNDETGILAHYFKEMTRKLITEIENRKIAELKLKDLNLELESKINARTIELIQNIEDLEKAHKQLVESERLASLGNIVSGVTHEINTPLGSGLSTTSHIQHLTTNFKEQLLANKMTKNDLLKYIDHMDEATELLNFSLNRAADLVQSFKLIAVNQHSNDVSKFYICDYIQKTLLSLKHEYKNSGHNIEFSCENDFLINSYPGAYSQIITNLLMNALVHAFNKGQKGIISISVTKSEDLLILSFKDNGVGIESNDKKHIFEPFFTTSKEKGGSGLGLNLVYNLVTNQLNGTIECISEIDKGTEFIIKTPFEN